MEEREVVQVQRRVVEKVRGFELSDRAPGHHNAHEACPQECAYSQDVVLDKLGSDDRMIWNRASLRNNRCRLSRSRMHERVIGNAPSQHSREPNSRAFDDPRLDRITKSRDSCESGARAATDPGSSLRGFCSFPFSSTT